MTPAIVYVAVTALLVGFVVWLKGRGVRVSWYEWILGALAYIGLIATIQHSIGTFLENEAGAFWPGMLLFGLPTIILLAVAGQLIRRRNRAG